MGHSAERDATVYRPSDEDMRAYLEGEHGRPHPEVVQIVQDELERAVRCCCESSPPEFGGNLPDRECPLHGERLTPPAEPGADRG